MRKHGLVTSDDATESFAKSEKVMRTVLKGFVRVCDRNGFKDDPAMYQATGFHIAGKLMMAGYSWARKNKGPEAADAQMGAILLGIFDTLTDMFGDTYTVSIKRKEKE
jgi:hypothetical protein